MINMLKSTQPLGWVEFPIGCHLCTQGVKLLSKSLRILTLVSFHAYYLISAQFHKGAKLNYAQHMNVAKDKGEKMPTLFTLSEDDTWPIAELKSVVAQMTSFHPRDRIKIADVADFVLKCMRGQTNTG